MKFALVTLFLVLGVALGGSTASSAVGRYSALAPTKARSVVPLKFICKSNADCLLSCKHGAVNRKWYASRPAPLDECKDGCAGKGARALCQGSLCVAVDGNGKRVESCSLKP